ncbi:MAG TPA: Crp/Fnr family transcriptional regulator [Puia sp.]|jgi:CRP-like cAMP-binding protein|nr:Crp/Fnr family transcriptional regulator [Puia sp.]
MANSFFEKFKNLFPLPKEQWEEYVSYYHRIEVPAHTILLREGEVSGKAYFIEKGCVRAWFSSKGKDITFQFFLEEMSVSSAESFKKRVPSIFTLETIEPSVLHWISKEKMDKIMQEIMQVPKLRDQMMDVLFERQWNYAHHFLSFIKYTPEERYIQLVKERPELIRRVAQQYIASYLGITPVSLSRIRSRLKK